MSEESKTASAYLYEDEFSYVTAEGEVYLKTGSASGRKLTETSEEKVTETVERLKDSFTSLQKEVREVLKQEGSSPETLRELREKVVTADAIGDLESLIADIDASLEEHSSGEQESSAPEAETEEASSSEDKADVQEDADEEKAGNEEADEQGIGYYRELVEKAEGLAKQSDWPYVSMELSKLDHEWSEGPDLDGDDEEVSRLKERFQEAKDTFEKRKKEHYEELNRQKQQNLEKKKELLAEITKLVENKNWNATGKVKRITGQWNSIGQIPSGADEELDPEFKKQLKIFREHKVDRLVQQRQKEEDNLVGKLVLLDKMEAAVSSIDENTTDWKTVDKEFDRLTKQWKKIGRVPKEKANEVWERYKSAQDEYYDRKYKFDEKHRKQFDKFHGRKEKLIQEAEKLREADDLANAARKINKLHRRWKKAGNLPQRDEDKLWDRFKSATDAFNDYKSNNIEKLREQEEEHYRQKLELIEEAETVKETTDWDEGHRKMQSLMDRWKNVGPVPRKKSNKIWKQFKGAMDYFYDRRRDHFKEIKKQRKDNLKEKNEILEQLRELGRHDDPIEAVEKAKPLQAKFKDAGYVPIKKKNKIWKEYREVCDVIYDRFRAAKSGNKFDRELARMDLKPEDRSQVMDLRQEFKNLQKQVRKLEEDVIQYKEKKTYFKPTDKKNPFIEELDEKIEKAEQEIAAKQDSMDELSRQIEDMKEEA